MIFNNMYKCAQSHGFGLCHLTTFGGGGGGLGMGLGFCLFILLVTSSGGGSILSSSDIPVTGKEKEVEAEEELPKAPVIFEQPQRKVVAVVGEDLRLTLKVKGEQPLRLVSVMCPLGRG